MPRKPRIEFSGAFYHVIARGNQRQRIFKEESDHRKYLQILAIYKNRYRYYLYAYVLMGNHVHLLLETQDAPLSRILQGINQTYTMYFNKKYRTVGHLFQGRYKAILCDRDNYLLALLKYIHHNPLRAKIAERLDSYPWSSHPAYIGKSNPLGLVDTDQVLRIFSESKGKARRRYREFMTDGVNLKKSDVYATVDQRLQGDEAFVERVLADHDGGAGAWKRKRAYSLERIAKVIDEFHGVHKGDLRSPIKSRQATYGRRIFTFTAKEYGYKGKEIADYLRIEPAAVTGYERKRGEMGRAINDVVRYLEAGKS